MKNFFIPTLIFLLAHVAGADVGLVNGNYLFSFSGNDVPPDPQIVTISDDDTASPKLTLRFEGKETTAPLKVRQQPNETEATVTATFVVYNTVGKESRPIVLVLNGRINEALGELSLNGNAVTVHCPPDDGQDRTCEFMLRPIVGKGAAENVHHLTSRITEAFGKYKSEYNRHYHAGGAGSSDALILFDSKCIAGLSGKDRTLNPRGIRFITSADEKELSEQVSNPGVEFYVALDMDYDDRLRIGGLDQKGSVLVLVHFDSDAQEDSLPDKRIPLEEE